MNRIITLITLLLFSFAGFAQKYKPTDAGSKVHFVIKNFGIKTGGDLSGLKGDINFLPGNLAVCNFNVSVDVNTIDTDNGSRDEHLKSPSYFNAEKYPVITIKSDRIDKNDKLFPGLFIFTGTLTMHGTTKQISFPFKAELKDKDYLFTGEFEINRRDFEVGGNSSVMGDNVRVSLSVLAKKN